MDLENGPWLESALLGTQAIPAMSGPKENRAQNKIKINSARELQSKRPAKSEDYGLKAELKKDEKKLK